MIKEKQQPFYVETVTLTSHGPFDLPEKYRELGLDQELNDSKMGGYFESLHYTDKQIGYFLDMLDKEGILQNSIIAIMGDHTGIHKEDNIEFAFKRLSIMDLENGRQPLKKDDKTIVFNGEIYNYEQLRNDLIKNGYKFNGSDYGNVNVDFSGVKDILVFIHILLMLSYGYL